MQGQGASKRGGAQVKGAGLAAERVRQVGIHISCFYLVKKSLQSQRTDVNSP